MIRGVVAALLLAVGCGAAVPGVEDLVIDAPDAHWFGEVGTWTELVGPVRPPSTEREQQQVEVWISIPPDATIATELDDAGVARLRFGPGTRADRLEWSGHGDGRRIVDVRGTEIDERGRCTHHVLRPSGDEPGGALVGVRWPCDDAEAATIATSRMRERLAVLPPFTEMGDSTRRRALDGFVARNDCDGCHVEGRPDARVVDEFGPVWRATDASGFFTPLAILRDAIPLESYGAFDPNIDDASITVECGDQSPRRVEVRHGVFRSRCSGERVPLGRIDWELARRRDPSRVEMICRARAELWRHLDAVGRDTFATAMDPCAELR